MSFSNGVDKKNMGLYNGVENYFNFFKYMREGKRGGFDINQRGLDINPRRTAVSETKGLFGGHGHTPDEFRPIEEVEADESLRGPGRHVNLNELAEPTEGESGEYLTVEDRMAAELDKNREQEKIDALEAGGEEDDEFFGETADKLANQTYEESAEEGGGPVVLDAPVKKTREKKDIKVVRTNELTSKKIHRQVTDVIKHPEKPKYKEVRPKGKITRY